MTSQLEKTKCEAMELWNRAKTDDQQRINKISDEQRRIEEESRAREEILRRGDDERIARDKARKEELRRQEELLSGRKTRSKTTEPSVDDIRGGGIQILHYKDPGEPVLNVRYLSIQSNYHDVLQLWRRSLEITIKKKSKDE